MFLFFLEVQKREPAFPRADVHPEYPERPMPGGRGAGRASASAPCHINTPTGTCPPGPSRRRPAGPWSSLSERGRSVFLPRVSMEPSRDSVLAAENRESVIFQTLTGHLPMAGTHCSPPRFPPLHSWPLLHSQRPVPALTSPTRTCISVAAVCADTLTKKSQRASQCFILKPYRN